MRRQTKWSQIRYFGIAPFFVGLFNRFVLEVKPEFIWVNTGLILFGAAFLFGGQYMHWRSCKE